MRRAASGRGVGYPGSRGTDAGPARWAALGADVTGQLGVPKSSTLVLTGSSSRSDGRRGLAARVGGASGGTHGLGTGREPPASGGARRANAVGADDSPSRQGSRFHGGPSSRRPACGQDGMAGRVGLTPRETRVPRSAEQPKPGGCACWPRRHSGTPGGCATQCSSSSRGWPSSCSRARLISSCTCCRSYSVSSRSSSE